MSSKSEIHTSLERLGLVWERAEELMKRIHHPFDASVAIGETGELLGWIRCERSWHVCVWYPPQDREIGDWKRVRDCAVSERMKLVHHFPALLAHVREEAAKAAEDVEKAAQTLDDFIDRHWKP